VFEFNPVTGRFNLSPGGEDGAFYIGGILSTEITSLTMGPDGYVWIGVGPTEPGFVRLDPNTSKIVGERILTEFMPRGLVFVKR